RRVLFRSPIVWCDFLWVHWTRRGPLAYRLRRRLDSSIDPHRAMAVHAGRYREVRAIVDAELAEPARYSEARRRCVAATIGPTDGRVSERIADYLVHAPRTTRRPA